MPALPPETGAQIPTTRLPKESAQAYEAWRCYAEMGPERSFVRVGQKLEKSGTMLSRWSSKFQWQERLRTWDDEHAEAFANATAQAALDQAVKMQSRRTELQEKLWDIQAKAAEKFMEMMNFPVAEKKVLNGPDGATIIVKPGPWRFSDAVRMGQLVQQIGAFATGMTKKLPDPTTGAPIGSDDDEIKPPPPTASLPKMIIEITDTRGAQSTGKGAATPPAKPQPLPTTPKKEKAFVFQR